MQAVKRPMELNDEQNHAVTTILEHCTNKTGSSFLALRGQAGTGKSTCMKTVIKGFSGNAVLTAPTNKAVRVLRDIMHDPDEKSQTESRTIFSLLGLAMMADGEVKELKRSERELDLSEYDMVVVDECYMLGENICGHIKEASREFPNIRWVFSGDTYQLPPVNEDYSPIEEVKKTVELKTVMRTDNQILKMATHLRGKVDNLGEALDLFSDNDGNEGVWALRAGDLEARMLENLDGFRTGSHRAVAWRNVTVDALNHLVRQHLYENSSKERWKITDRITLMDPVKDIMGSEIIGTTDEDGVVEAVSIADHPRFPEFQCWRIVMRTDSEDDTITLWVLRPSEKNSYEIRLARLAAEAKANNKKWRDYWAFRESFHNIRHAYASTVHKTQGSTHIKTFCDFRDITRNPNLLEQRRCMYTAGSRPKQSLYLG